MILPTLRAFSSKYKNVSIISEPANISLLHEIEFKNVYKLGRDQITKELIIDKETLMKIQSADFEYFISLSSYHNDLLDTI